MSQIAKAPPASLFRLATDSWTEPYWRAAAERRLVAPRCCACSTFRMPPTPFCPECRSQELEWVELSGRGVIYSYTVVNRALVPEAEAHLPFVPIVVELAEAPSVRLVSNLVGAPVDAIHVGALVEVAWEDLGEGVVVPRFVLADGQTAPGSEPATAP